MAKLKNADIRETWISNADPSRRYFVTKNHRVVRVEKNAFASGKMMYIDENALIVNFRGHGRFAHANNDPQAREFLNKFTKKA